MQQVDQARQDLVAADAAVKNAKTEVERTTDVLEDDLRVPVEPKPGDEEADLVPILAPGRRLRAREEHHAGQTIAPGQDAFVIGDLSQVWMLASVRQDDLGQLRVGQPVDGHPGRPCGRTLRRARSPISGRNSIRRRA